jgi:hypothetical protein
MRTAWLFFLSMLVLSCEQKEGERCQQNGDCGGGMICCKSLGAAPESTGVCKPLDQCTEADTSTDTEAEADGDAPDQQENAEVMDTEQESSPETVEETGDPSGEDISVEDIFNDTSGDAADGAETP